MGGGGEKGRGQDTVSIRGELCACGAATWEEEGRGEGAGHCGLGVASCAVCAAPPLRSAWRGEKGRRGGGRGQDTVSIRSELCSVRSATSTLPFFISSDALAIVTRPSCGGACSMQHALVVTGRGVQTKWWAWEGVEGRGRRGGIITCGVPENSKIACCITSLARFRSALVAALGSTRSTST